VLWPFNLARSGNPWPTTWPDLNDPRTKHCGNKFTIYLPWSELARAEAVTDGLKQLRPVLIDGRTMAAIVRIPFPGEEAWTNRE